MSDEEDDYLSDKFLVDTTAAAASSSAKTYTARRKEALRVAALKNEQNRRKSRRELEQESREEGLSKSLFERAKDEAEQGVGGGSSKALAMMMKMGFQPGQSLGQPDTPVEQSRSPSQDPSSTAPPAEDGEDKKALEPAVASQHRVNPLPLNEWTGKTGIGLRKRAVSPNASQRLAKMARMAEDHSHTDFRDRARIEYEERRAEKQLGPAQRTCTTLDEKAEREFNVLWLNPANLETFPDGLVDAFDDVDLITSLRQLQPDHSIEGRLRACMKADALQPVVSLDDEGDEDPEAVHNDAPRKTPYSEEDIKEAVQFLRLTAKDRLELVLDYLRRRYAYCFWCGTQYSDHDDMYANCPGQDEESHD
ncbi:hypothetical protein PHLGIDRAFT_60997 [Phlebiopsis gigantea 11061_1 CR5-6]|uniref:DUF4187 domain-containing protein n=1 Tax=Phlebiopsis gigantea (strain 11061_1 CR5-6) TaxID=745531 RepID=A0A0C3PXI3_PHLG1|nr:hypothetical protein PHLGIDRAFT_60997 [Phlebiopsis gigantea 11061_1 CR5-6]